MSAVERQDILIVEPFNGGSHGQLIKVIQSDSEIGPRCAVISLPAKKWHWRARTSALYFSQTIPVSNSYRVIFTSSVLNLAELIALRPDLAHLKKIVYFHENQLMYPVRKVKDRDFQYGYNQILTSLVASIVVFNSAFNMESFLSSISSHLKLIPDHRPKNLEAIIRPKCRVLNFPVNIHQINCGSGNSFDFTYDNDGLVDFTNALDIDCSHLKNDSILVQNTVSCAGDRCNELNYNGHSAHRVNSHTQGLCSSSDKELESCDTNGSDESHKLTNSNDLSHKLTNSSDVSHKPTHNSNVSHKPTHNSNVSHKPINSSNVSHKPTNNSNVSHKPTNSSNVSHKHTDICDLSQKPTDICDLSHKPTDICDLSHKPTTICDLSHKPTDSIEMENDITSSIYYFTKTSVTRVDHTSDLLPVPINVKLEPLRGNESYLHIVWPHRWEHDKDPESFFQAILQLQSEGCEFHVSVVGETFTDVPDIFHSVKPQLAGRIVAWGYQTRQDYLRILDSAHVVVSTALHEFFGVSMLEATGRGCYPLCPRRLVYPEIYPEECLYSTQTQLVKRLKRFCQRPDLAKTDKFRNLTNKFSWHNLQEEYRKLFLE